MSDRSAWEGGGAVNLLDHFQLKENYFYQSKAPLAYYHRIWGYQLNTWPCFSGVLEKVTCPVYTCTVAYIRQVTFYKVQENTAMFNWSLFIFLFS